MNNDLLAATVTWAEIDVDAISNNVSAYRGHVGPRVEIIAVVKANAYGHGAAQVGRVALESGATRLAVHRLAEGIQLRQAGIKASILVMGYTPPGGARLILEWRLTSSITTWEFAQVLSDQAVGLGMRAPVHVKVDTGMNRYGLLSSEAVGFISELHKLQGIEIEGLFTHFATADWEEPFYIHQQLAEFNGLLGSIRNEGIDIPIIHAANSAAAMHYPEAHYSAIRPGVALYGLEPSSEWHPPFEIYPALSLKSRISRLHTVKAGEGIGYGHTYVAQNSIVAALVPVGYGDGYHRVLSNKGCVLVRGQRAPIIGRVSMDQLVVDVSRIGGIQLNDEVVLIGMQGGERIRAEEVASLAGTINYEVTTSLLPRVLRVYRKGGEIVEIASIAET